MLKASLFAAAVLFTLSASAQTPMKPGLWEVTNTMNMGGMPAMSPEQMEKMKQMGMANPYSHAMTAQICVTPEQAAKHMTVPPTRPNDKCSPSNMQITPDSVSGTITCDGASMKGEGNFKVAYSSGTSYTGTFDFKGTGSHGPITMHNDFSSHFVSADCGSVAPRP